MKLNIRDIIIGYQNHNMKIEKEIIAVRNTGYTWKYIDSDKKFRSENSSDPFFDLGWKLKVN